VGGEDREKGDAFFKRHPNSPARRKEWDPIELVVDLRGAGAAGKFRGEGGKPVLRGRANY